VQRGAFGACLMAEPALVADGVKAMVDVVDIPVTVKHRIGIDRIESYGFVRDFVGQVSEAGCRSVHRACAQRLAAGPEPEGKPRDSAAALRDGLSAQKRISAADHLPERRCDHQRADRHSPAACGRRDGGARGVSQPLVLAGWDEAFFGQAPSMRTPDAVEAAMVTYMEREAADDDCPWYPIARHMLGLRHGQRGARKWRQVWSDHRLKPLPPAEVHARALQGLHAASESMNSDQIGHFPASNGQSTL
jgi:tRNA-dihydrouridine synthase A